MAMAPPRDNPLNRPQTRKERDTNLVRNIREAVMRQEMYAREVVELVKCRLEAETQAAISAGGREDIFRAQGAARAFQRLLVDLTTTPPNER